MEGISSLSRSSRDQADSNELPRFGTFQVQLVFPRGEISEPPALSYRRVNDVQCGGRVVPGVGLALSRALKFQF
jgi:hypothetical protein